MKSILTHAGNYSSGNEIDQAIQSLIANVEAQETNPKERLRRIWTGFEQLIADAKNRVDRIRIEIEPFNGNDITSSLFLHLWRGGSLAEVVADAPLHMADLLRHRGHSAFQHTPNQATIGGSVVALATQERIILEDRFRAWKQMKSGGLVEAGYKVP